MPYIAPLCKWGNYPDINNRQAQVVDDFCKALCYLSGASWSVKDKFSYQVSEKRPEYGQWFDWGFFEVKIFKKGTGHFKFKNADLWAIFNQQIARIKGFPLPESIKKKAA